MRMGLGVLLLVLAACSGQNVPVTTAVTATPIPSVEPSSPTPTVEPSSPTPTAEPSSPTPAVEPPSPTPTVAPARPADVTFPASSEEYGCTYSFHLGTKDQTMALHAWWRGDGEVPVRSDLPHPDWDVYILRGSELFENWCNDVALPPGSEKRHVDSTWTAVAGTITLKPPIPPYDNDYGSIDGTATGSITDLVVRTEDGRKLTVEDVTITNETWGFFPG